MWDLAWGSRLDFLNSIAEGAETEEDIPECLRTRPVLNQYQRPVFVMFLELTGSRQHTFNGVAEIPYHIKVSWLNENEVYDCDDRQYYLHLLSDLDDAYLKHFYENRG